MRGEKAKTGFEGRGGNGLVGAEREGDALFEPLWTWSPMSSLTELLIAVER